LLFSSPQAITKNKTLQDLIEHLVGNRTLSMICIDKAHLFVQFGRSFRAEFQELKPLLFDKIVLHREAEKGVTLSVPVMFMTATFTKALLDEAEVISGLSLSNPRNIFWPTASGMEHRSVFLDVKYSSSAFAEF